MDRIPTNCWSDMEIEDRARSTSQDPDFPVEIIESDENS